MSPSFRRVRALALAGFIFAAVGSLHAQSFLSLGAQYNGWAANSIAPFNGHEIMAPFDIGFQMDKDWNLYGQTAFANGSYTDSVSGTETLNLTAMSDSVIGTGINFQMFGTPALFDLAVNIPTGDPSWEVKEGASNVPTEFIDTRYVGAGFGMSAMYGLAFPNGKIDWGVAAAYYYSGALSPDYGSIPSSEKLGDSFLLGLNRTESFDNNKNSVIRFSASDFLTTQISGADTLRLGPNLNLSYAFNDPKGLSYEIGGQFFLPADRLYGGTLSMEPHDSLGQRFYLSPSLALGGDWSVGGMVKYITPNGYSPSDPSALYDGGGFLFGLTPSYAWKWDAASTLTLSASYDFIIHHDAGFDAGGGRLDLDYSYWTIGATYGVKL
jgi:hypothetical protein